MSRPKKTILLIDPNEQSRSRNRFLLDTRGFRVLSASTCADALDILATELPELLWVNVRDVLLPAAADLIRMVKQRHPGLNALLTVPQLVDDATVLTCPADIFLHGPAMMLPALVLLRVRLLTSRKRGPKKRTPIPAPAHTESRSAA